VSAVVVSSLRTSLARYTRSSGLWVLLLVAPVGARFMIAGRDARSSMITVADRIPWLTSPMLGTALGVVIATLLLPIAFLYLRANVNRRQPWQVEETAPASRVAVAYGRWLADVAVLAAALVATTAAGWVLALVLLPTREVDPPAIALPRWAIAAPAMAMTASLRIAFDARPWTRGPLGEVLYFVFWMTTLVLAVAGRHASGFGADMFDLDGFVSPLSYARGGDTNFAIGGAPVAPGSAPIHLDVMAGVLAPGYLAARLTWLGLAASVPLLAGLAYAPHAAGKTAGASAGRLRFLEPGKAPPADPQARPARAAPAAWLNLVVAEIRLIVAGRVWLLAVAAVAACGLALPWSAVGPASMLVLVFTAAAHAGRSEPQGLLALTRTGALSPFARRCAFVAAGTALTLLMGAGAIVRGLLVGETWPLLEATVIGAATSLAAIVLGALSRSATAPRLVLLIAWYAYASWAGR
jgi:hypothetical protein